MSLLQRFKHSFLRLILITISMVILAVPFMLLQINYPHQATSFNDTLIQHSFVFTVFRWLVILGIYAIWPWAIVQFAKKQKWNSDKTLFWLSQRLRMVGWLIVFELVVCENILLTLIKLF